MKLYRKRLHNVLNEVFFLACSEKKTSAPQPLISYQQRRQVLLMCTIHCPFGLLFVQSFVGGGGLVRATGTLLTHIQAEGLGQPMTDGVYMVPSRPKSKVYYCCIKLSGFLHEIDLNHKETSMTLSAARKFRAK